MVSVIIPVYVGEKSIEECLRSLESQSYTDFDIIVVDDGSPDKTWQILQNLKTQNSRLKILKQAHSGPGNARNFAVKNAKGSILVFVDADMTFDKDFIKNLIKPIQNNLSKGTFTKDEYVSNWENSNARGWNYILGRSNKERIPQNYPDKSPVFRAILKKEFDKVSGFDTSGTYIDDWSLSRKLGYKADIAQDSLCYHQNPASLRQVYTQARWIGKNEFITGSLIRKIYNLGRFNPLIQIPYAIVLALKQKEIWIIPVACAYSFGVQMSIIKAFTGEKKYK